MQAHSGGAVGIGQWSIGKHRDQLGRDARRRFVAVTGLIGQPVDFEKDVLVQWIGAHRTKIEVDGPVLIDVDPASRSFPVVQQSVRVGVQVIGPEHLRHRGACVRMEAGPKRDVMVVGLHCACRPQGGLQRRGDRIVEFEVDHGLARRSCLPTGPRASGSSDGTRGRSGHLSSFRLSTRTLQMPIFSENSSGVVLPGIAGLSTLAALGVPTNVTTKLSLSKLAPLSLIRSTPMRLNRSICGQIDAVAGVVVAQFVIGHRRVVRAVRVVVHRALAGHADDRTRSRLPSFTTANTPGPLPRSPEKTTIDPSSLIPGAAPR